MHCSGIQRPRVEDGIQGKRLYTFERTSRNQEIWVWLRKFKPYIYHNDCSRNVLFLSTHTPFGILIYQCKYSTQTNLSLHFVQYVDTIEKAFKFKLKITLNTSDRKVQFVGNKVVIALMYEVITQRKNCWHTYGQICEHLELEECLIAVIRTDLTWEAN